MSKKIKALLKDAKEQGGIVIGLIDATPGYGQLETSLAWLVELVRLGYDGEFHLVSLDGNRRKLAELLGVEHFDLNETTKLTLLVDETPVSLSVTFESRHRELYRQGQIPKRLLGISGALSSSGYKLGESLLRVMNTEIQIEGSAYPREETTIAWLNKQSQLQHAYLSASDMHPGQPTLQVLLDRERRGFITLSDEMKYWMNALVQGDVHQVSVYGLYKFHPNPVPAIFDLLVSIAAIKEQDTPSYPKDKPALLNIFHSLSPHVFKQLMKMISTDDWADKSIPPKAVKRINKAIKNLKLKERIKFATLGNLQQVTQVARPEDIIVMHAGNLPSSIFNTVFTGHGAKHRVLSVSEGPGAERANLDAKSNDGYLPMMLPCRRNAQSSPTSEIRNALPPDTRVKFDAAITSTCHDDFSHWAQSKEPCQPIVEYLAKASSSSLRIEHDPKKNRIAVALKAAANVHSGKAISGDYSRFPHRNTDQERVERLRVGPDVAPAHQINLIEELIQAVEDKNIPRIEELVAQVNPLATLADGRSAMSQVFKLKSPLKILRILVSAAEKYGDGDLTIPDSDAEFVRAFDGFPQFSFKERPSFWQHGKKVRVIPFFARNMQTVLRELDKIAETPVGRMYIDNSQRHQSFLFCMSVALNHKGAFNRYCELDAAKLFDIKELVVREDGSLDRKKSNISWFNALFIATRFNRVKMLKSLMKKGLEISQNDFEDAAAYISLERFKELEDAFRNQQALPSTANLEEKLQWQRILQRAVIGANMDVVNYLLIEHSIKPDFQTMLLALDSQTPGMATPILKHLDLEQLTQQQAAELLFSAFIIDDEEVEEALIKKFGLKLLTIESGHESNWPVIFATQDRNKTIANKGYKKFSRYCQRLWAAGLVIPGKHAQNIMNELYDVRGWPNVAIPFEPSVVVPDRFAVKATDVCVAEDCGGSHSVMKAGVQPATSGSSRPTPWFRGWLPVGPTHLRHTAKAGETFVSVVQTVVQITWHSARSFLSPTKLPAAPEVTPTVPTPVETIVLSGACKDTSCTTSLVGNALSTEVQPETKTTEHDYASDERYVHSKPVSEEKTQEESAPKHQESKAAYIEVCGNSVSGCEPSDSNGSCLNIRAYGPKPKGPVCPVPQPPQVPTHVWRPNGVDAPVEGFATLAFFGAAVAYNLVSPKPQAQTMKEKLLEVIEEQDEAMSKTVIPPESLLEKLAELEKHLNELKITIQESKRLMKLVDNVQYDIDDYKGRAQALLRQQQRTQKGPPSDGYAQWFWDKAQSVRDKFQGLSVTQGDLDLLQGDINQIEYFCQEENDTDSPEKEQNTPKVMEHARLCHDIALQLGVRHRA